MAMLVVLTVAATQFVQLNRSGQSHSSRQS